MKIRPKFYAALGAYSLALAALPLTALATSAVGNAEGNCAPNFYFNTATNQCQYCDPVIAYWNPDTNQCIFTDPTPYVDPILGPAGPVGVGPNPVVGPVGPVGVGPNPVVGPVGPVGVGPGPVVGPVGPVGVGPGPVVGPFGPGGIGR